MNECDSSSFLCSAVPLLFVSLLASTAPGVGRAVVGGGGYCRMAWQNDVVEVTKQEACRGSLRESAGKKIWAVFPFGPNEDHVNVPLK